MEGPGRPTVMTPEVLAKLDDAFMADATDEMACFLAGISPDTLYYYQTNNPGYSERKKMLKDNVRMQARMAVNKAIRAEERPDTAKWYLERRDKEYKPKSDHTTNDKDLPVPILTGTYDRYAEDQGEHSELQQGVLQQARSDSEGKGKEQEVSDEAEGI